MRHIKLLYDYFIINSFLILLLLQVLQTGCTAKDDENKRPAGRQTGEMTIEGRVVLLDTMPLPHRTPKGNISKEKPGNPDQIEVKQNKVAQIHSQKVLAGKPAIVTSTDSGYTHPVKNEAIYRRVRAGIPVQIDAKEPYSVPENPFSFSFYTRSQGLPHDDIRAITIDHQGKFWIATFGGGLVSYNGTTFNHYTTEAGLQGNTLLSLFVDRAGDIWFGLRNEGVTRFDGKYFETFTIEGGLYSNNINSVYQDSKGNFWFCSFEGGISKFDGKYFTNYNEKQGLPGNPVIDIVEDDNEHLWFATAGGGVVSFDGVSFLNYSMKQGLSSNHLHAIAKDSKGNLWLGTNNNGISVFDGKYFYNSNKNTGLPSNQVLAIYKDNRENIWIGTRNKGLVKFDGKSYYNYKESEGLINTHITDITEDIHNRLWFGTFGSGVGQYNGDIFTHLTESEGFYDSFIRSILQDPNDNIWLASNTKGIYIYDRKNTLFNYTSQHGLPSNNPRTILRDSNNNIWMGFVDGSLVKYDGEHFCIFTDIYKNDLLNSIVTMWEDMHGNLWIGTLNRGIFKFDGKDFFNYTIEHGLVDNNISKIYGDDNGNIWISSFFGGISKFDGNYFTNYTEKEGLPNQEIFDMIIDSRGILWAATNGNGVYLLRNGKYFFNFKEKHGLGSNFAYSVFEDSNRGLWFGTRMGLSKMLYSDKLSIDRRKSFDDGHAHSHGVFFKNYTKSDGFHGIGCNSRAIFEDKKGKIWIGANDIITVFNPVVDIYDTLPPNVHLTNIGLFNENIPWVEIAGNQDTTLLLTNGVKVKNFDFDYVGPWYGLPQNLRLAHNNNYIVFNYSGTNGRFQHMMRYQHMLEGLNESWSPFTKRTEVHYGNLPPGKYTFKLKAMNSETYVSKTLNYPFIISPPWWRTWWAYLFYFSIALFLIAILYRYRKVAVQQKEKRRREEWLMQQEVEVARKSVEFKQNFLANMSHEIRTPLTGLMGMTEILNKTPLNDQQKDYLQTLIRSGENLRETINMVLDYSKIEAGQYTINKMSFSMKELLNDAEKYFLSICKKDIVFKKVMEKDVPEFVKTDRKKVFQIITNLLSNASKYTNDGKVGLHITLDKSSQIKTIKEDGKCLIKVSVSDTGKGISNEEQKKLFKPFYQIEQEFDRSYEGTGLGLTICKELTAMLGGKINLVSQKNQGATFWFTFQAEIVEAPAKSTKQKYKKSIGRPVSLNILYVEDKVVNQKVVQLMLESLGHTVSIAFNGENAIEKYTPNTYDLILMDIQMPVMDGITATEKLREKYDFLPPIVGLSANAFEGDREKYMNMGMDEYITKPVSENDFLELIEKLYL